MCQTNSPCELNAGRDYDMIRLHRERLTCRNEVCGSVSYSINYFKICVKRGILFLGIEARTELADVGEVTMANNLGIGI